MRIVNFVFIILLFALIGPPMGGLIVTLVSDVLWPNGMLSPNWLNPDFRINVVKTTLVFSYIFGLLPSLAGGLYLAICVLRKKPFNVFSGYFLVACTTIINPPFIALPSPLLIVLALIASTVSYTLLCLPLRKIFLLPNQHTLSNASCEITS